MQVDKNPNEKGNAFLRKQIVKFNRSFLNEEEHNDFGIKLRESAGLLMLKHFMIMR